MKKSQETMKKIGEQKRDNGNWHVHVALFWKTFKKILNRFSIRVTRYSKILEFFPKLNLLKHKKLLPISQLFSKSYIKNHLKNTKKKWMKISQIYQKSVEKTVEILKTSKKSMIGRLIQVWPTTRGGGKRVVVIHNTHKKMVENR